MKLTVVALCLALCVLANAYTFTIMSPQYGNFQNCQQPVCYSGQYTGYGCNQGRCPYVCSNGVCDPMGNIAIGNQFRQIAQSDFMAPWGIGAGSVPGCNGGNCGYWGGCSGGSCSGYYDFSQCRQPVCSYGPFYGYGCNRGQCGIVCYDGHCHDAGRYDNAGVVERDYDFGLSGTGEGDDNGGIPTTEDLPNVKDLKVIDLDEYEEMYPQLHDVYSNFWRTYINDPYHWHLQKNNVKFWLYLFDNVGALRKRPTPQQY